MTEPQFNLEDIAPSKAKAWVGLIGSLLTLIGPAILQGTDALPSPWPLIIGLVFAVLTTLGVYRAPYKPTGTVLAPTEVVTQAVVAQAQAATQAAVQAGESLIPGVVNPIIQTGLNAATDAVNQLWPKNPWK
jgi:hypothetical protein